MSDLHSLYQALHGANPEDAARELGEAARRDGARVVVVSACLLGERTRFDGGDKHLPAVVDPLVDDPMVRVLPLCPEILGGMGCPRPPVHFSDGSLRRAVDDAGVDRTEQLDQGAARAERLAGLAGAGGAVLKERSPSCGVHRVHAAGDIVPGRGRFADRLARRGLSVSSEENVSPGVLSSRQ